MKYYAKKDILVVDSYIKAGDEILLLKKGKEQALISRMKDNLLKWVNLDKFDEFIETRVEKSSPSSNQNDIDSLMDAMSVYGNK